MAVALPFVGAAVGWLAGGTAFYAQVGWMVGSMIYSAMQPGQTIKAGDPSSAPSVGSDIRGQNIPVIFGTVRASGYLMWQHGFKSTKNTRKVGSGKKKSKQEYYSYTWDFMFHMGHATVPYRIIGMWEGSERIQDDALDNITFADGTTFVPAVKVEQQQSLIRSLGSGFWRLGIGENRYRQVQSTQAGKSLSWSESYFYGAHDSASVETGWSFFQTAESAPNVRWPSSVWIGFKQLELGEQPRIPQLNFEITPDGNPTVTNGWDGTTYTDAFTNVIYGTADHGAIGVTVGGGAAVFTTVDSDDLLFTLPTRAGPAAPMTKLTRQQSIIDMAALGCAHTDRMLDTNWKGSLMIPGTNDVAMFWGGLEPAGPSNEQFNMVTYYEITEDGAIVPIGFEYDHFNLPIQAIGDIHACCLNEAQSTLLVFCKNINLNEAKIYTFPYARTQGSSNAAANTRVDLSASISDDFLYQAYTYQRRIANLENVGFMVPMTNGNIRFYWYMSVARVHYTEDNVTQDAVTEALAASYPNGGMFYYEFTSGGAYAAGPVNCDAAFDQNGPPFTNDAKNDDGSDVVRLSGDGYTEIFFAAPASIGIQNSKWVVGFQRDVSQGSTNGPSGTHVSYRCFSFNPADGSFEQIGTEATYEMDDTVQVYDVLPIKRYTGDKEYSGWTTAYASMSGEIFRIAQYSSAGVSHNLVTRLGRARIGIVDLTPPEIVYEIFTNDVIGFGKAPALVDSTTYQAAVDYCENNGIKISAIYGSSMERVSLFEALVNVYGGWVAWTGTTLRFGKPTETFSPVGVIDNDHFVQENPDRPKPPLNGRRQALQDTTNKVTVKYYDRTLSYRQNEITLGDEVDQDLNGVRHKQLNTGFIMSKQTAYRLCERTLWGNMYARNIYSDVLVGWKSAKYEPGDLITLVDSFSNTNISARIVKKEEIARGRFRMTFIEELDYLGKTKAITDEAEPTPRGLPTTTEAPLDFSAYELPPEFSEAGPRYYVGYAPGGPTAAAGLYTSPSTTDFRLYGSAVPYPDGGRILTTLPANEDIVSGMRVVVNAKSGTNVTSIDTWFTGDLQDFNSFDRTINLSTFRVGSELLAYEGATLVGSNVYELTTVYRGWGGTKINAHSPGDVWWLHDAREGGGIFAIPYPADQIGTTFYYKVVPVGFDGVEYDPTSISYKSYTILGQHFTPRPIDASDLRILVGSDSTIPASLANQYGTLAGTNLMLISPHYTRRVGSSDERNFMFTWPETSKNSGFGAKGYGTQPYGDFTQDVDTVSWLVSIVGSGGNVVRSVTVTTPGFAYDAITNAADNGAWRGILGVSILPKNGYGNSPFSAVVSLNITA